MPVFAAIGVAVVSFFTGAAVVAGTAAAFAASMIGFGLAMITAKLLAPSVSNAGQAADQGRREQLPPATDNKIPLLYGTAYQQGAITYAEIAESNKTMYYVITLCEYPDTASTWTASEIYWNDEKLTQSGSGVLSGVKTVDDVEFTNTNYNGNLDIWVFAGGSAAANCIVGGTSLAAHEIVPSWTSTDTMDKLVFAVVKLKYNADKGFQGLSPVTVKLTNSLTNPAVVWRDLMTSERYGAGLTDADLDSDIWNTGNANSWISVCNQTFNYTNAAAESTSQARYTVNGVLSTHSTVMANINHILSAGAAWMAFDVGSGKWKIVQKRASGSVFSFNNDNITSSVNISSTSLTDLYNEVEVEFPSRQQKDQTDLYKGAISSTLRHPNEPDNKLSMRLELVNNNIQAQQIGNMELKQSRDDLVVTFNATYAALQCQAGDVIDITNDVYGWSAKLFRITRLREIESDDGNLIAEVVCLEYNASVYSDEAISEFQPAANINVPGFGTSYSLTSPATPAIISLAETSTIPSFVIDVTTAATGGPWDRVDLFYATSLSTNPYQYYGSKFPTSGATFATSTTVTFTATEFTDGLYYFKARAGYQGKFTPLSGASALVDWDPTVVAETDPAAVAANLYWTPNPVIVPADSDGSNPVTGQVIYLNLRIGTEAVELSASTTDAGMANDTWRLDTQSISAGLTLSAVTKNTTNDRLEWTVTGLTAQTATLTATIRYKDGSGTVFNLGDQIVSVNQLRYGEDGTTGSSIRLNTTDQVFSRPKGIADASTNLYVPATITLTALRTNISGATTFTATANDASAVTLTGTGDTRTLSNTAFGNHSSVNVEISAVQGGVTYLDEVTIVRVREGEDGDGAVNAFLTNETHGVPVNSVGAVAAGDSDSDGIPNDLELAFTFMKVLVGSTDDTANWSFSKTDSNCTSTLTTAGVNKGKVQITALGSSDIATVEITATKAGYSNVTKVFSIDKVYRGADGASAITMRLVSSAGAFQRGRGQTDQAFASYTPTSIIFEARKTGMDPSPSVSWYVRRYLTDGTLGTEYFWISGNTATMTATNFISWAQGKTSGGQWDSSTAVNQAVQVRAETSYAGVVYQDTTSIYKLIEGDSTSTMLLTNEAHTVPASSAGVVSSYTGASTDVQIFVGTTNDTANWTYGSLTTSAGVTASRSGNTVTISALASANDSGFVDISATKSGLTLTKRFSISKSKAGATGDPGTPGTPGTPGGTGSSGITARRCYQVYVTGVAGPATPENTVGANTIPSSWNANPPTPTDAQTLWVSDGRYNINSANVEGIPANTTIWGTPYRASVFFNTLQSDNFSNTVPYAGWRIVRDTGAATFNQVTVRGDLDASSITTSNLFFRNATGGISTTLKDPNSGTNLNSVANTGIFNVDTGNLTNTPYYEPAFFLVGPSYHSTSPLGTSTPQSRRIPRADQLRVLMTITGQVDHYLSLIINPNWTFSESFLDPATGNVSSTKTYSANTWTNVGPNYTNSSGYSVPIVGVTESQGGYGAVSLSYLLTMNNVPTNAIIYFGASVGGIGGTPAHGYNAFNNGLSNIKSLNYTVVAFNS